MAHRRLAELDGICNVLHTQLIVVEGVEYLDAGRIAEHPEQIGQLVEHLIVRQYRRGLGQLLFWGKSILSHRCHPFASIYEHLFTCS